MDIQQITDANGNPVFKLSFTLSESDMAALTSAVQALQQPAPTPTPTPPPPPVPSGPPPQTYPTFSGPTSACSGITPYSTTSAQAIRFVKFGDNTNSSSGSTNAYVYASNILLYWSQLNPKEDTYDWSALDNAMQPWKKVIIRVSASGEPNWNPPYSAQGTPQFVFDAGVKSYKNSKGAIVPQYWNTTFKAKLQKFVTALGARYNNNPNIEFLHVGVGMGGECKPDTSNDSNMLSNLTGIGWNNDVWFQHIKDVISYYKAAFPTQRLAIQTAAYFNSAAGGTKHSESDIVNYAISQGVGLQNDGIGGGNKNYTPPDPNWKRAIFISAEQRDKTSQTGTNFECDVEAMISFCQSSQPIYCFCFADDLLAQSNQAVLQKYTAMSSHMAHNHARIEKMGHKF